MITLVALLCHQLNGIPVCVEEIVPQSEIERQAGKIEAPLPMAGMSELECQVSALPLVAKWVGAHPVYRTWTVVGWQCARDYVPKGRA
jgi:hypothetical protein